MADHIHGIDALSRCSVCDEPPEALDPGSNPSIIELPSYSRLLILGMLGSK